MALRPQKQKDKVAYPHIPEDVRERPPSEGSILSKELSREFKAYIFDNDNDMVKIAAVDPDNANLRKFVAERLKGGKVQWFKASDEDMHRALGAYVVDFVEEIRHLIRHADESNAYVAGVVDHIIRYGLDQKASDIHVEPTRANTVVRFRIDGILHPVVSLPRKMHEAVVARFKILGDLKIDEYRHPQDGRIELDSQHDVSFRISTIPLLYGEKVALRVLDASKQTASLERLGFSPEQAAVLKRNVEKPFGMIVASGPTGSGKTTSLYEMINLLNKNDVNISTLEDPIEYALPGVNQMQTNAKIGLTFSSGLRALLRQDPDVIMVGEIRDSETAIIAANAALTGHLVLTTLHTNDAPSALNRFLEMKIEDFVVSSTINLVIAQRLVRKICEQCAAEQPLDPAIIQKIKEHKELSVELESRGVSIDSLAERTFRMGTGCNACLMTGYRDRIGLFELLEPGRDVSQLILQHASSEAIRNAAKRSGFKEMVSDGVEKILSGQTTFEEVIRSTRNL